MVSGVHEGEVPGAAGLGYEVVHAGTDAALFAELESAYQRKAPWLGWIYTPHWAPIKFEGEWVEFPEYEDACYQDPSWGVNPDMTYDCGKPHGWIKKVGWKGGEEKWPCAYEAIRAFNHRLHADPRVDLSLVPIGDGMTLARKR